jgi:RimJ/RimL family protein N-acetyltransferase
LKRFQNKGYTSQSAKAIIDYALYTLGFDKVFSKCYKQNTPSKNMLKKIGMQLRREDENFYYFDISSK